LAFDTLFAEGQRRYVESLSAYARQFLDQMQKPAVEHIEGLSPAIAIEQRTAGSNPRSIVATTTEVHDYLRLLFANIGIPHCPKCGRVVERQSAENIVEQLLELPEGTKVVLLAPLVRSQVGTHKDIFEQVRRQGYIRVRVDGEIYELDSVPKLKKSEKHSIDVVVDRLVISDRGRARLTDSVELALKEGDGDVGTLDSSISNSQHSISNDQVGKGERRTSNIEHSTSNIELSKKKRPKTKDQSTGDRPIDDKPTGDRPTNSWVERAFSEKLSCVDCGVRFEPLSARSFSFNSPYGACPKCSGLGMLRVFDRELVVPDESLSLNKGAVPLWRRGVAV
jgi:excinuclease ABC subunit A